jgi:riboflavin kinase/FMN adenylyltransferase
VKLIRGLHNVPELSESIITIGNFDGIHLGHQILIKQIVAEAQDKKCISIVISFQKTASEFFGKKQALLTNFREKYRLLNNLNVDCFLLINFNQKFANLSAVDFVEKVLLKKLKMKKIIIGDDFRFGKNRQGSISLLNDLSEKENFIVSASDTIKQGQDRVSSSAIRQLLEQDEFIQAQQYLGRKYSVVGRVIKGNQLGRTLGFPTLNIALKREFFVLFGIFIVEVKIAKTLYKGVASVGSNPSVNGKKKLLEVFLFDFNQDVYCEVVEVFFLKKIREEKNFETIDKLKIAITKDCEIVREYFEK